MNDLHVVLGYGQIGSLVADALLARGTKVRVVRRGAPGVSRPGLEWASGDLSDGAFAVEATSGAAVVYDCTSPPYDAWSTLLLPLARGAMLGATRAGAKLVALDNLYMYGRASGPLSETTPVAPCSKKGELRAQLARERAEAHQRGDLVVATGRATDFFGPGVVRQTTYGERFFQRAFAGKRVECFGDPDAPHAVAYGPDVARGLVALADRRDAVGVYHLPAAAPESMRAMTARLASALALPIEVTRVGRMTLRALGVVMPIAREVAEMAYQWDAPYLVDDSLFRGTFGFGATQMPVIIEATAAWARATFGGESARAA